MTDIYTSAVQTLQSAKRILVVSHANPDGDALGSTLALGLGLKNLGKHVIMYNKDPIPHSLKFLPHSSHISCKLPAPEEVDLAILVDCAQPKRISDDFEKFSKAATLYYVDHHLVDDLPANVSCIDPKATATGHVVYEILKRLGASISLDIATCIYTTLVTDTDFFRYSNTTPEAFELAGELMRLGVSPATVSQEILENCPKAQVTLLPLFLETMEFHFGGRCASMVLTLQMLEEANATPDMAENFINYGRSVAGVEVAVLFREQAPKRYKVSLRSKKYANVAELAAKFGGGGHFHAAGCTLETSLPDARETILAAIESILR